MYHLLSYPIEAHMPAWPDSPQLQLEKKLQIAKGDVANTSIISLYNHVGTHYDAPNHIWRRERPSRSWIWTASFREAAAAGDPQRGRRKGDGRGSGALCRGHRPERPVDDLHRFSRLRLENEALFEQNGPGIGSDCAAWLVEHGTGLRALAVDFVSLASFSDQEDGNEAHRILFRGKDGRFICGIEDVNMAPVVGKTLKRVFALPLLVRGVDSAPVTMVAETE